MGRSVWVRINFPSSGYDLRNVQPIASRHTVDAIWPHACRDSCFISNVTSFILISLSTILNSFSQSEVTERIIWSDFLNNVPSTQRQTSEVYFWHAVFWNTIYIFVYLALENTLYTIVRRDAYVTGATRTNSVASLCTENHSLSWTCCHHILLTCFNSFNRPAALKCDRCLWNVCTKSGLLC